MILHRVLLAAQLPLALFLFLAGAGFAKADVFTVRGITVDAIGEDVIEAKQIAIRQGQAAALQRLWVRLVREEDRSLIPIVEDTEVERLVQNFSLSGEKSSDIRYLADMTVQFAAEPIRNHLRFADIPYVDKPAPIAVVLPVFSDGVGEQLWQTENPWLSAWIASFTQDGLSPLIAPLGDLEDMSLVDAERAVAGDPVALSGFAERHGTENAIVVRAALLNEWTMEIRYREFGIPERVGQFALSRTDEESPDDFLLRGVAETQVQLERDWRRTNTVRFDQQAQLLALIRLQNLSDWIAMQRDLNAIPAVAGLRLLSLTREAAVVDLGYFGPSEQLDAFFQQRRLTIRPIDLFNDPDVALLLERRSNLPAWQISRL